MAKASATAADASAAEETTATTTETVSTAAETVTTTTESTATAATEKTIQLGKCAIKYQGEYRTGQLTLPVAIADKLIADGFASEVV